MKKHFINPQGNMNFSQIVTATSTGPAKTIWLAGMVAPRDSVALEKGTLREQADAAMQQIVDALAKCGAKIDDVTRFSVYIKDIAQDKILDVAKAMHQPTKHIPEGKKAASTYVGVTGLAHPKMLVEIEATAQIPAEASAPGVNIVHMNPMGRYNQIVTTTPSGPTTTLWISGQTGSEEVLGKPIKDQAAVAMKSMEQVLAQHGAKFSDVVRFNTYIPNADDTKIAGWAEAFVDATKQLPDDRRPANTLLGVTGLADERMMLECEAVAVIPAQQAPEVAVKKEFIGPEEKMNFSQAVATTTISGPSTTTLWLAGMTASNTPAADKGMQEQTEAALGKLQEALAKCGGRIDDVVALQTYVVNVHENRNEKLIGFGRALNKVTKHLPRDKRAANTLVGVTGLAGATLLVEIQATAILPWGLDLNNLGKL